MSLELVNRLLDRLQPEDDTITRQLEALVPPLQGKPRADLYAHISRLIFERYSTNPGKISANLCTRLCQSLFLASLRIHNPSGPDPIATVHDYLFSLCVTPALGYRVGSTREQETTNTRNYDNPDSIRRADAGPLENAGQVNIESTAPLVSSLFGFSLISVAQIDQYLFQFIHPSLTSPTGSRLSSVCTRLEAHGRNLNVTAWGGEMGRLLEWAEATILEDTIDEDMRRRIRAITSSLGRSKGQEPFTGADREKIAPSPKSPSGEPGSTGNNYGGHTSTDEFGARSSPQPTKTLGSMELKLGEMLTKLEEGDFDDISDQIIEWLNKSEKEEGGKALTKIAKLICERVKETETFGKMYARLCRKTMEQISPSIQDGSIQNSEGKPLNGGMLFRKCLLNQCQEGFERRWSVEVAPDANNVVGCRGPGLVLFIAELFKVQMLTERIAHDCIKKLLSNVVDPEEEDIENLCKLFKAIGHRLDNLKMKNHMDVYFKRMQGMANRSDNFQIHIMLSDVIELRARHRRAHSAIRRHVDGDNSRASGFQTPANQVANFEPVVPLEQSKNRWVVGSTQRKPQRVEVRQLVKALLNKLTMEKFDLISDQIIEWTNKSEQEKDGSTLMQVIKLVFEKAKDEAMFSEMYARLCRKMMERVSPNVKDETIKNSEGRPITGGMLFRKYLLSRCQEDFERGWSTKEAALAAVALRSGEDKDAGAASGGSGEAVFHFDEYYAAAKAKRQGLGLVRFMDELFKLQMLTERIMHECIKKLLSNIANPEEEEIESLCKLLTTVGQSLDKPKARNHMDVYFERMQDMVKSSNINSRMQFMLLDVIELRARHWQSRATQAGEASVSRPSTRTGDLSQFGKISKPRGIQFGPSSVFNKREFNKRDSSIGRAGSASMFSALSAGVADHTSRPSVDFGPGRFPASSGIAARKKIVLQPKTVKTTETGVNETDIEEERKEAMTAEEAEYKVKEDVKEYLSVESIDEAIMNLEALPSKHRHLFVDRLINAAMDSGNKVVILAEKLFSAACSQSVITPKDFERGMLPTIEMADDLSIDIPKTYEWLARMIHAAGLDKAKAEEMAGMISVYGEPRVAPRELLMKEFEKVSSA